MVVSRFNLMGHPMGFTRLESSDALSSIFPKRPKSRGFRNQKEGGAGFWPISPGSVSEGGAGALAPIDVTPIQRCTSVKYTFGWSILGCTPRRGALGDTQRNLAPPRETPHFWVGTMLTFGIQRHTQESILHCPSGYSIAISHVLDSKSTPKT